MGFLSLKQVTIYLACISIFIGIYTLISPKKSPVTPIQLEEKSIVLDKALISVRPTLLPSRIEFNIDIETYEFPTLLTENLAEHCIVTYQNMILPIVNWEPSSYADNHVSGTLDVDYSLHQSSDQPAILSLSMFFSTSYTFSWTFN